MASPVDRGKPGSKIHALSDRAGLPLAVAVSAANTNDSAALKPLVMAIPVIRSRRGLRRRTLRYERKAEHFLAFLLLGAALTCYKKHRKLTT
ncbi:Transposase DDE domain-containing protein [Amycolatopsis lurida]|uniref:Transposase IS4-like domain-containing protein n=1 Tax=Amycolatopsis lurida NRRL 2430 TaxID=1460371 RepID=A0A2P2FER6_AMYLU|nr:hypothetical protein BB31_42785 [Amycolatopsis lurida NRRL 2430]SEE32458.1 Transposase DDE domain-containing protein [Amycolatopsis lurida]